MKDIFMEENFLLQLHFHTPKFYFSAGEWLSDRNKLSRHTCNFSLERDRRSAISDLAGNNKKRSKTAQTNACKTRTRERMFFYPCFLKLKMHCQNPLSKH